MSVGPPFVDQTCTKCGSLSYSQEWLIAFNVTLCHECKRSESLISKGTAKELYVVTDADLKKLGSLSKANPHKKEWSSMRLYLDSQVEALAYKKHGGPEGVEDARASLSLARADSQQRKRQSQEDTEERTRIRTENIKRKILEDSTSQHDPEDEVFDAKSGKLQRYYTDGAAVEIEKI